MFHFLISCEVEECIISCVFKFKSSGEKNSDPLAIFGRDGMGPVTKGKNDLYN